MATQQTAPIYVSLDVWNQAQDVTEVLRMMQQEGSYHVLVQREVENCRLAVS
jgi:hypothetical protein